MKCNGKVYIDTETYYMDDYDMERKWKRNEMEKYIWIQGLIIMLHFWI